MRPMRGRVALRRSGKRMARRYFKRTGWWIRIKLELGRDFSVWHGKERIDAACRQDLFDLVAGDAPIFMDQATPEPEDGAGLDETVWVFRVTNSAVGLRYRFVGPREHAIKQERARRAEQRRKALASRRERAEIRMACGRANTVAGAKRRSASL